ncbi:hypothetical protein B0H12DRAFT_1235552 [Mycena haematopus]|nr:hypothetical protein B0H12DRAFT_1235552 [Mycena haematopus]
MNRPRPSVLQLFDPLSAQPSDGDKENSFPYFDFFTPYVEPPLPVRLTRRLVEVGDVTVEAGGEDGGRDDEDEENENDTIRVDHQPPSSPRTPLADVTFDRERTPMRSKIYRRKANAGEVCNPASNNYAFASVLDAVDATVGGSYTAPSVVICPPEESNPSSNGNTDTLLISLATPSLATPTGSLIADTTLAFPTPSEASLSLLVPIIHPPQAMAALNVDCSSTDLHSSFGNFLLGDGDEESFDMGKELVPIPETEVLEEAGENSELLANVDAEPCLDAPSATAEAPKSHSSPPRSVLPLVQLSNVAFDTVPQHSDVSAIPAIAPSFPPVFVAPPIKPIPVLLTSLPEPPALIPALKIVKRKRPETTTVPAKTNNPLISEPNPPAPDNSASSSVPLAGRDKEKGKTTVVANLHKTVVGGARCGPQRVPLPCTFPIPSALQLQRQRMYSPVLKPPPCQSGLRVQSLPVQLMRTDLHLVYRAL